MKNYRALAKLRKRQFEQAEQDLALANAHLAALERKKELLREQMRGVEPPQQGQGRQLGAMLGLKSALKAALEAVEMEIAAARARSEEARAALKRAHLAWEQARSIESRMLQKAMNRARRREAAQLDEIAGQRFWRHREPGARERE